jgi:hypothetical protein
MRLPLDNGRNNVIALVDLAIVHDNHGVRGGIRLHFIEETKYEFFERIRAKRTLANVDVDDAILERDCRQN